MSIHIKDRWIPDRAFPIAEARSFYGLCRGNLMPDDLDLFAGLPLLEWGPTLITHYHPAPYRSATCQSNAPTKLLLPP